MLALSWGHAIDLGTSDARHGHGCFETVRVQEGRARWLDLHLERLAAGCAFLGLEPPPEGAVVEAFLESHLPRTGVLHLTALDGQLLARTGDAPPPVQAPARLEVAEGLVRFSGSPLNRFKTLSYLENRLLHREAAQRGCFDVVALNEQGRLTDGGRTSLFVVCGGRVRTPPAEDGALPGIARRVLLEAGLAEEAHLLPADLERAEGIFLANALRGVVVVRPDPGGRTEACAALLA